MSKEVIYIDVKDDVTSVIDKIKKTEQKIVALVPPKQIGILQSAVNLQLLAHTAKQARKVLVIITNQEALLRLAAVAKIPVAKSLTTKPSMPEIPALKIDGDDDIIDGSKIGVGEMAGIETVKSNAEGVEADDPQKLAPAKIKVPNYDKFRKRLFIGGVGVLMLGGFLIWATIFAPRAEITITTDTKGVNVSTSVTLVAQADQTNLEANSIYAQTQKSNRKRSYEFEASGEKTLRTPATGKITLIRVLGGSIPIPAGTIFSSGSCSFATTEGVTLPGRQVPPNQSDAVDGQITVGVAAVEAGDQCNLPARNYTSAIAGISSAKGTEMTGGSARVIKVMTQADLDKAKEELIKDGHDSAIKELRNKFDSSMLIINDSLNTKEGEIIASAKIDEEVASGKVKLEQEVEYQISAFARKTLEEYLGNIALKDNKSDKVKLKAYNAGIDQAVFSDFVNNNGKMSVRIASQVQIGPEINPEEVKEFAKGKPFGDVRAHYNAIEGVNSIEITLSPFWVRSVPSNPEKISVIIKG